MQTETIHLEATAAALMEMTVKGIPPDVQELLVHGNPERGIPPNVLACAIWAAIQTYKRS